MVGDEDMQMRPSPEEMSQLFQSQRTRILEEISKLSMLPKASSYVQHRLKVAQHALAIVQKNLDEVTADDMDELEKALNQLGL
mmetsp:Transcript_13585/g.37599  ORF Transcript_13585/g.37599 Transcript_13585/m.37599 type:complete len:83 (-) Transcript_13585:943-1191(-)